MCSLINDCLNSAGLLVLARCVVLYRIVWSNQCVSLTTSQRMQDVTLYTLYEAAHWPLQFIFSVSCRHSLHLECDLSFKRFQGFPTYIVLYILMFCWRLWTSSVLKELRRTWQCFITMWTRIFFAASTKTRVELSVTKEHFVVRSQILSRTVWDKLTWWCSV